MAAPSGKPAAVVRIQSFGFGELPSGAPGAVQPSMPVSNEVEPSPVDTSMSSTNAPSPCVAQSLTYAIESSTCLPAYAERSTRHCCQPPEAPENAFHVPVVPVGVHIATPSHVW